MGHRAGVLPVSPELSVEPSCPKNSLSAGDDLAGWVLLAQPGIGGPVRAGGAQQVITFVQDELAAGLAGGAALAQRAVPAGHAEGGDPGAAEVDGVPGRAAAVPASSSTAKSSTVNPPATGACSGLGLITAWCPASQIAPRRVPGTVGGTAVPGQRLPLATRSASPYSSRSATGHQQVVSSPQIRTFGR